MKRISFDAKPKSNVERIDKNKMAVLRLPFKHQPKNILNDNPDTKANRKRLK